MPPKKRVLILCTGNSARSQMAEGLLRHEAGGFFEVHSAGTKPTRLRTEAIAVMKQIGIDISRQHSKPADQFAGQAMDYVITVCGNAKESCPVFPTRTRLLHWPFEDPAKTQGSEDEILNVFRQIRDHIKKVFENYGAERKDLQKISK